MKGELGMKKNVRLLALLAAMTTFTISATPISAQISDTQNNNLDVTEYEKVLKESEKNFDGKLDNEKIYKCYRLEGLYAFNNGIYEVKKFEDTIFGEVRTYVEIGDKLVTIIESNGKLNVASGETLPLGYKSVVDLNKEEEKLRQQIDEDIADVKYCGYQGAGAISLSAIYFKTVSGKELVVPFIDNYDYEKKDQNRFEGVIENGKFYSGSEFIEILKGIIPVLENGDIDSGNALLDVSILGDVNNDGKVDARDCSYIVKRIANRNGESLPDNADYNKDGKKNVRDAAAIAVDLSKLTNDRRD